ncbi:hypothetical protein F5144DRAFT_495075 [Chaetomium tenue]|uniref:Uncharacterized protein n=1 Tax=Chaetomium tenue TaxID=1854479 RepID=A0ACB7P4C2_9PEZI|nr:hypothetical protein F5144DRAFT_495075 [Chaetomium globosum]
MSRPTPRALPDKLILVTNGTHPLQLQIIKQLLQAGSRVRTTVPSSSPSEWLDKLFARFVHTNAFQRVKTSPRFPNHPSTYQLAVRGVHAIVHDATPPEFSTKTPIAEAWAHTERGVLALLEAAAREPSVEALTYTSALMGEAAAAAVPSVGGEEEEVVGGAEAVRNSCLVKGEETLWGWVRDKKPRFKVNVVSPANVIGYHFAPLYTQDWMNWVWTMYWNGGRAPLEIQGAGVTQAHWYVDVEDVALLHIASIFDERIRGERLQAWGWYRDRNDVIDIMRDHTILEGRRMLGAEFDFQKAWEEAAKRYPIIDDDGTPCEQIYPSSARALAIFADGRWKGYGRWKEFERTIRQSLAFFDVNWQWPEQVETGGGLRVNGIPTRRLLN